MGSRQQSRFIAMMSNYSRTMELVDTAYDSTGRSAEQFAKNSDTIDFKINRLKNSWEQFTMSIVESDWFKKAIDFVNSLVGKLENLSKFDIGALITTWLTVGRTSIVRFIKDLQSSGNLLKGVLTKGISKAIDGISKTTDKIKNKIPILFKTDNDNLQYIKSQIEKIKEDINKNQAKIDFDISEIKKAQAEVERLKEELNIANLRGDTEFASSINAQIDSTTERISELQKQIESTENKNGDLGSDLINLHNAEQEENRVLEGQAKARAAYVSDTFVSALTVGITAGMTAEKPWTAVWTTFSTGLMMTLPSLLSTIAAAGGEITATFVASTAGLGLVVIGITAAIAGTIALIKSSIDEAEAQKINNRIENIRQQAEKTQDKITELKNSTKELKETEDSLEDIKDTYNKFENKTIFSPDEQEEYNKLIETLKNDYPELISYYDEETNQIRIQSDLLDDKIEKQKELLALEQKNLGNEELRLNDLNFSDKKLEAQQKFVENFVDNSNNLGGWFTEFYDNLTSKIDLNENALKNENVFKTQFQNVGTHISLDNMLKAIGKSVEDYNTPNIPSTTERDVRVSDDGIVAQKIIEAVQLKRTSSKEDFDKNATLLGLDSDFLNEYKDVIDSYVNITNEHIEELKSLEDTFKKDLEPMISEVLKNSNPDLSESEVDYLTKANSSQIGKAKVDAQGIVHDFTEYSSYQKIGETEFKKINEAFGLENIVSDYSESFKNIASNLDWSDFKDDDKQFLAYLGMDASSWKDFVEDRNEDEEAVAQDLIDTYINTLTQEATKQKSTMSKQESDALKDIDNAILNGTFGEVEAKIEQYSKNGVLSETGIKDHAGYEGLKQAKDSLAAYFTNDVLSNMTASTMKYFSGILDGLDGTLDEEKRAIGSNIENVFKQFSLNQKQQQTLLNIDITQGYEELLKSSDQWIKELTHSGLSIEQATQAFSAYIDSFGSAVIKGVLGSAGAEGFKDTALSKSKEIGQDEKRKTLISAINEQSQSENGTISRDTYWKLQEAGFEDYLTTTQHGYALLSAEANKFWAEQTKQPERMVETQIEQNEKLYNETGKIYEKITGFQEVGINKAIQDYQAAINEGKSAADAYNETIAKLNQPQEIRLKVKEVAAAGYSSIPEYLQALKLGLDYLRKPAIIDIKIQDILNFESEVEKSTEDVDKAKESIDKVNKSLEDNKKALEKAEKALQEAIHGTDNYRSSLDGLINYTTDLEKLQKELDNTKESLANLQSVEEGNQSWNSINQNITAQITNLQAQNNILNKSKDNILKELQDNFGDYIKKGANGLIDVDFAYEKMDAPDKVKDAFAELVTKENETILKAVDNNKEIQELIKQREELYKDSLDKYVSIQNNVINILKEQSQEEVNIQKEKYEALEEADNEYLNALEDAINKQRKLREQESQYEDLATKEKKLSLMRRDTSGANQKEVQSLEKEIDKDRQTVLDSEIDNTISAMKELYETQKEARDAEIEYMEAQTENTQYFAEWAESIMASWENVDDMSSWFLQNDFSTQDMTVEQTEQYLNQIKDQYTDFINYTSMVSSDFSTQQEDVSTAAQAMVEEVSNNIEDLGTYTTETAKNEADEIIQNAKDARDNAAEALRETQKEANEAKEKLKDAEKEMSLNYETFIKELVGYSASGLEQVSTLATTKLLEYSGVNLKDSNEVYSFLEKNNLATDKGVSLAGYNAAQGLNVDVSSWKLATEAETQTIKKYNGNTSFFTTEVINKPIVDARGKTQSQINSEQQDKTYGLAERRHGVIWGDGTDEPFNSIETAKRVIEKKRLEESKFGIPSQKTLRAKAYKTGGLVNYTGPAWVDGTPTKPEAFLNSEDTKRIGAAARLLAEIPILNSTSDSQNAVSTNVGDTQIEVHINVESLANDYDVDRMINRVKKDIYDDANPIGSSVFLRK